jgi:hypothetical protein
MRSELAVASQRRAWVAVVVWRRRDLEVLVHARLVNMLVLLYQYIRYQYRCMFLLSEPLVGLRSFRKVTRYHPSWVEVVLRLASSSRRSDTFQENQFVIVINNWSFSG